MRTQPAVILKIIGNAVRVPDTNAKKSVTGKNKFMARIAKETADIAYRVTTKYC